MWAGLLAAVVAVCVVFGGALSALLTVIGLAARRRTPAPAPSPARAHPPAPPIPSADEACTELWALSPPRRPARGGRVIETQRQAGGWVDGWSGGR